MFNIIEIKLLFLLLEDILLIKNAIIDETKVGINGVAKINIIKNGIYTKLVSIFIK